MTKKEAEKVADAIFDKLIVLLNQDNEALSKALSDVISGAEFHITDEEMYLGELSRLETLRMLYQENQEFEKCAIIKHKIDVVKDKLNVVLRGGGF